MALAATLAACGSSSSSTTTTATTSTTPVSLPSTTASVAQIRQAYATLFDLSDPAIAPKLAVVQGGSGLSATFASALHSPLAKLAGGASVSKVTVTSGAACTNELVPSPCAKVTYSVLSPKHKVVLPGSSGIAVYEDGHWLVAKVTICTLLELEDNGTTPAGC